MNRGR